ncbi:MAG: hypothetical protein ABJG15_08280 [Hyphomonadaceae bacterium]
MDRTCAEDHFERRRKQGSDTQRQTPLVVDAKQAWSRERKDTSILEQRWPVYLGVGIPALVFGGFFLMLLTGLFYDAKLNLGSLVFVLPIFLMAFALASVVLTYVFSSIRSSAETLGNISFLSQSNTGFKIGAALGLGLFLWFTPIVFGDPFTGNPSAPSAIVAQLALKALTFIGVAGAVGSKLEERLRR